MINSFRKGRVKELEAKDLLTSITGETWKRLGGREIDKVYLSGDICPTRPQSFFRNFSW